MGLRFRRTLTILPGIRLNISASGLSLSIGPRGASITLGRRGTHLNAGIPGTGLSWRQRLSRRTRDVENVQEFNTEDVADGQDHR